MFSFLDNANIYLAMSFKCSINIESNIILIANSKSDSNFNKSDSKSFLIESISSKADNDTSNNSHISTETNGNKFIGPSPVSNERNDDDETFKKSELITDQKCNSNLNESDSKSISSKANESEKKIGLHKSLLIPSEDESSVLQSFVSSNDEDDDIYEILNGVGGGECSSKTESNILTAYLKTETNVNKSDLKSISFK